MHPTQNQVSPATPLMVADTLRRAALYLIRHGWSQHRHYDNSAAPVILRTPDTFPTADVVGALVLAVTGQTRQPADLLRGWDSATVREFNDAIVYLASWLGLLTDCDAVTDFRISVDALTLLWTWNDFRWQDQAHVIDGLLCAAADADGTVYIPDMHRPYAADFAALGLAAGAR